MTFGVLPLLIGWRLVTLTVRVPGNNLADVGKRSFQLGERRRDFDKCFGVAKHHRVASANIAGCVHRSSAWEREKTLHLLTHDKLYHRRLLYDVTENDRNV